VAKIRHCKIAGVGQYSLNLGILHLGQGSGLFLYKFCSNIKLKNKKSKGTG